jgi:hypothetical protein
MLKKALLAAALLAMAGLTGVNYVQPAQAACYTPHSHTTEYWAWVSNSDPNDVWCGQPPLISPPFENYYHWAQVGEYTIECDGTITQWGVTSTDGYGHSCTGSYNTVRYSFACDPICD